MTTPDTPDRPSFDIVAFEAAAKNRATAFIGEVARLATLSVEDEPAEWQTVSGAQYALSDSTQVAAKHEIWDDNPKKVVAKLKITRPPVESLGRDHNLRRVRVARLITCRTFLDEPSKEMLASLWRELTPAPELDRLGESTLASVDEARLEDKLVSQWRPGELIWARTTAEVECKLPNSPNFRTERNSSSLPRDVRMAHIAARRHAGEPVEDTPYTLAEHSAVMALMGSVDERLIEPEPLDNDFEEAWLDPEPNPRSWWPKEW